MKKDKTKKNILLLLMCVIVVDVMGFGLVLPLLPNIFISSGGIMPMGISPTVKDIIYALAFIVWPLGSFFGNPILGKLSDRYGRKTILTTCLILSGISYIICGLAIISQSIVVFILGRLISGFFCGSYDIAQAATVDISAPEDKVRNMSWISFAVAIGIVIGPVLAVITSNKNIIPHASIVTPFWIAGGLSILNALLIIIQFHETNQYSDKVKIKLLSLFTSFTFIFKDKRVVLFGAITFLYSLSWGLYIVAMPLILKDHFGYGIMGCGILFSLMGLGDAFSILFIQKKVLKIFTLKQTFSYATIGMCIVAIISGIIPTATVELIGGFMIGVFHILAYASLLGICSNSVTGKEQGLIMGGMASVGNLAMLISGLLLPILVSIQILFPLIIVGIVFLTGSLLMLTKAKVKIDSQSC
jgi:MFS transporter, DHA1 family, tetracycline resistance protein